jgi:hypothetical protein
LYPRVRESNHLSFSLVANIDCPGVRGLMRKREKGWAVHNMQDESHSSQLILLIIQYIAFCCSLLLVEMVPMVKNKTLN